jgi:hypothetical protein
MIGQDPELGLGGREAVGLENRGPPVLVDAQQQELAHGGDQHLAVGVQVAEHLGRLSDHPHVATGRLDFDGAAGRFLAAQRTEVGVAQHRASVGPRGLGGLPAPHLIGCEQAAVGQTGAVVLEVHEAADLGLQPAAHLLQQLAQGGVVRELRDSLSRELDVTHIAQVVL